MASFSVIMSKIIWLRALLLFNIVLIDSQITNSMLQPGIVDNSPNILSLVLNTKKYDHTISDHFLSITLEPSTLFLALQKNPGSTLINMARALRPAFLRISGPECNFFKFQGGLDTSQSSPPYPIKYGKNNITITGWHWSQLNEFLAKTGLDLIVGLNIMNRQHGIWDLSNTVDLLSYSDKHGYNMEFQLGDDIQAIGSRVDGVSLGRDATRLRKILEAFPRYKNSAIIGPDIKSCSTQEEIRYLKNFIIESGPSISALTYQIPFSSERNVENPTEMLSYVQNQLESRVWQKDLINKYLGKISVKKPLWIIESGSKDRKGDFTDGLIWAQRLCAGAKVGINTIMRKPSLLSFSEPTPDYWVSVLHKAIVGSEVLDIKILSGNKTRLETVAHCTKMSPYDPNEGILAPEYRYSRGAITIFGVNMGSESVKISLKTGQMQSMPIHQYFLTGNNRQNIKRATKISPTLINGQKLILSPDGELPIIIPKIRGSHQLITIPNQCVFFLVLPDIKSKACTAVQVEEFKESYKYGGKMVDQEEYDDIDYDSPLLDKDDESITNEKNIYVTFRPKHVATYGESVVRRNEREEITKFNNNEMDKQTNDEPYSLQQNEPLVKYVTFSNNNWLSKFPKSLNNQENLTERLNISPISPTEDTIIEVQTEKNVTPFQNKKDMYHILAQAVTGNRHPNKNIQFDEYPNLNSALTSLKPSQKIKLVKRSLDGTNYNMKENLEMVEKFTNREKPLLNTQIKTEESSSEVSIKPNKGYSEVFETTKKYITKTNPTILEGQESALTSQITQQKMITSTPVMSTAAVTKRHHESHIQKIKTRKEQVLAKLNEKSLKIHRRKLRDKHTAVVNTNALSIEIPTTTCINDITTKKDILKTIGNINNIANSIRYNRQTNNTNTGENVKNIRPRVNLLKSKKSEVVENAINAESASSSVTEIANFEPSTIEVPTNRTTKLRHLRLTPKILNYAERKPVVNNEKKLNNAKTTIRMTRETTHQPTLKSKFRPVLHPLGKVLTPPDVNVDQIKTNEKITEKLLNEIKDGMKTLKSVHIVGSINKNEKHKRKTKSNSTAEKIRALEAKSNTRRSEIQRRLKEKIHKVEKRSPTNDIIEDDIMDINNILSTDRFGSNELDVDVEPVLKNEMIRSPRSVADFTVKLNEVNTYVDKNGHVEKDPKSNDIKENNSSSSPKNWRATNDIRLSAEDSEVDNVKIKLKRKSIFDELISDDDDDYTKTTNQMMNKIFSHMQNLWKFILKKTFIL